MKDPIQKIIEKIPPFLICGGQEFGFAILHDTNEMKMGFFPVGYLPEGWVNPLTVIALGSEAAMYRILQAFIKEYAEGVATCGYLKELELHYFRLNL